MSLDTLGPRAATLPNPVLATPISPAPRLVVLDSLRRGAGVVGELVALLGVLCFIPVMILAIGIPIALCVRLLLWAGGLL